MLNAASAEVRKLSSPQQKSSERYAQLQGQIKRLKQRLGQFREPWNNNENAFKVVHYYVRSALDGLFQGNAQWQIGYGPGWTRANTTFAVMRHFLEDRPPLADLWPAHDELHLGRRVRQPEVRDRPSSGAGRAASLGPLAGADPQ